MAAEQGGAIRKAVEVVYEVSEDELARARALRREIFLMDQASLRAIQEEKGRQEGWIKGIEEGRTEGRQEERKTILDLIRQGYTMEQIAEKLASQIV